MSQMLQADEGVTGQRVVARRFFTMADQHWFATLSGDNNPLHVDPVAARRSTAGAPVVHGTHALLWCLDAVAATLDQSGCVTRLRVNFDRFIVVDEPVEAVLVKSETNGLRAEIRSAGATVVALVLSLDTTTAGRALPAGHSARQLQGGEAPVPLDLDQIEGRAGKVESGDPALCKAAFPHAARVLGASRIAGLNALTRLVGMICPGLYSIYNSIALTARDVSAPPSAAMAYRVKSVDLRYRRVVQDVQGCGWTGTITCASRHPPTRQAPMRAVEGLIEGRACAGSTALIVGGSRGLGELTAKLIASAGGRIIVTWLAGEADAQLVVDEIRAAGGEAEAMRYDVRAEPASQLAQLTQAGTRPTHLCYFATPAINDRASASFSPDRFARFTEFYVTGFHKLVAALRGGVAGERLSILYPSSVAVGERPRGMTEYAMAKAAGEILCSDLAAYHSDVRLTMIRLPRLATDQTATLQQVETEDAVSVLLPAVKALYEL